VQSLWGGYGEVVRYEVSGVPDGGALGESVIVKHVKPGKGQGRSHDRKMRSYDVERVFYERYAARCAVDCRVAACHLALLERNEWLFVFEDLNASGYGLRTTHPNRQQLELCLRWLAAFHATFLEERPSGLWKIGTYWHLRTRPDEHRAMAAGRLRDRAGDIDERLRRARYQTIVHGDAKPSNFCFQPRFAGVAAVDFQYAGGGCGIKDVAYLLVGEDEATVTRGLNVYFEALRQALTVASGVDMAALEREWRALYPWAMADFHRFVAGWAPSWKLSRHELAQSQAVLDELAKT
jgi:hypothetical protein